MNQENSTALRQSIPDLWLEPDDSYGWRGVALVFVPLVGLVALAPWAVQVSPWLLAPIALLLAGRIHHLTIVAHDCCHFTLFKSRATNRAIGEAACILLGSDFGSFSRIHWIHHNKQGGPDDPQGVDYNGLQSLSKARLAWHLLQPLFGFSLFKVVQFNGLATRRGGDGDAFVDKRWRLSHLCAIAAAQIALAILATGGGRVLWLAPLYPICAGTLSLLMTRLRSFGEHAVPRNSRLPGAIRSHRPNLIDSLFFHTLNFNYHVEHHRVPNLPSRRLPDLHARLADQRLENEFYSAGTLATVVDYFRSPRRVAETGVGAVAPPHRTR